MSSDDSPRFMKSTGRSVTASRGGNISRRTLRLSRVRSETPCSSLRRCAERIVKLSATGREFKVPQILSRTEIKNLTRPGVNKRQVSF